MARNEKGQFATGTSGNPQGKPVGIQSKAKEMIDRIINDNEDRFLEELNKTQGAQYCKLYIELLAFTTPKMRAVDLQLDFDKLSDGDIELIASEIVK